MVHDLPDIAFVFDCLRGATQRRGLSDGAYYVVKEAGVLRFISSRPGIAALNKVGVEVSACTNMRLTGKNSPSALYIADKTGWAYLSLKTYDHIAKLAMSGGPMQGEPRIEAPWVESSRAVTRCPSGHVAGH
jgi:hypothetical protein